jgi:hypothetical protein
MGNRLTSHNELLFHPQRGRRIQSFIETPCRFYVRSGILVVGMTFQRKIPSEDFTGIQQGFESKPRLESVR